MPIMENVRLSLRQSRKFGKEIDPESKFGLLSASVTSCSGSGSGFSNPPFTTENRAVFAPMPNASVRIATAANTGDLAIIRTPNRKSCIHRSRNPQPHASRVTSRTNSTFPNSLRAARTASSSSTPRSTRSLAAISRWLRTSSPNSSSRFRLPKSRLTQFIAAPLFLVSIFQFLFVPQRYHRIDSRCPPGRQIGSSQCNGHKKYRHGRIRHRIPGPHSVEQTGHQLRQQQRPKQPDRDSRERQPRSLPQNHHQHFVPPCSKRDTNSNLSRSLSH